MQTRFAASKLARYLHQTLAAVDHHLHCLAFVLLRIHRVLSLFCFHRVLFLSLSSRVRQIGGGSHADSLRCIQARALSAPDSCRCGSPSPLPGFCIAPYTPGALSFLLPSGPLSFFEFPCPSNRGRFRDSLRPTALSR